ncbi:MAG: hypothetical protein Q3983_09590 [Capnocytophaga sp.]|nr:hypothetical protein [Capnocytophaga sp.]
MKKYFVLFALCLGLASCGNDKQTIILDNPTNVAITCAVDGKDYNLEANTFQELEMTEGSHTLKLSDGQEIKFDYTKEQSGSVLNPTNTEYVIVAENYSDIPFEKNHMYQRLFKEFSFDGEVYYGPFEKIGGYFIAANVKNGEPYHYGLNEPFDENITLYNKDNSKTNITRKKIYRPKDFKEEYKDLIVE